MDMPKPRITRDTLNARIIAHNRKAAHLGHTDTWTQPDITLSLMSYCLHFVDPAERPPVKRWADCTEPERDRWRQFWADRGIEPPAYSRRDAR